MSHESHRAPSRDPSGNDFFAGLGPPTVPAGLGHRVLIRARASARGVVPRRPLVDRLWESRPLWLAWAAGVVVLLGMQLMLASPSSLGPTGRSARVESPATHGAEPRSQALPDSPPDSPPDSLPGSAMASELGPLLARHPIRGGSPALRAYGGRPGVSLAADSLL